MVKQDKLYGEVEITHSDNIYLNTVSNGNESKNPCSPAGPSGPSGPSGTAGSNGRAEIEKFKQIGSKYHFKGKYPNPH
jgi:hypothetical protein